MGGDIGVQSEAGVGSTFWFSVPVRLHESDKSRKMERDLSALKLKLLAPVPIGVLIYSRSEDTRALLATMLEGFNLISATSFEQTQGLICDAIVQKSIDFVILDDQSELRAEELARSLQSIPALGKAKIVHLFTPTATSAAPFHLRWTKQAEQLPDTPMQIPVGSIVRLSKPPRRARVFNILAALKDVVSDMSLVPTSNVTVPVEDPHTVQRTLYGNVLIAEDNPIAQQLLVKQLERYHLTVTATSNGSEAVAEWEAREPGFYSVALFDHHMPICDGVEAAKRIRSLEMKRKTSARLPIVALSADCQESSKQLCLSAGMNAFLSKPLRKNDLISLLSMFWTLVQPTA